MKNVIVAHPGKQHSYRLASALEKAGLLKKYITTIYWNPDRYIYKLMKLALKGKSVAERMTTRCCPDLCADDIKQFCEIRGLFINLLLRLDRSGRLYRAFNNIVQDRFSAKVAGFALRDNAKCVVMYDTSSLKCFKRLESCSNIIRVMDMASPARNYILEIYRKDIEKAGSFAASYKRYTYLENDRLMKRMTDEIRLADHFIVASSFCRNSLIYNGINRERIHVVPYGVDVERFNSAGRKFENGTRLRFLFAGKVSQAKGIKYLLEAMRQINSDKVILYIAGSMEGCEGLMEQYSQWYEYLGCVPETRIHEVYQKADVFIFPSMWDGFGLVILEAMASGLPVICSSNTGGTDVIENGKEGFIVPAGSIDALKDRICFFINNPESIEEMGRNARKKAEWFTWDRYEKDVSKVIKTILNEGDSEKRCFPKKEKISQLHY